MNKYAATAIHEGNEVIVAVLPLSKVPKWNPENPQPGTYLVDDSVQKGWIRQPDGSFTAPPPKLPPPKLAGVAFAGVMCSATAEDQAGVMAVHLAMQMQGAAFQPTKFYFENGNTLVLHPGNFQQFLEVWMPFRQSFYLP